MYCTGNERADQLAGVATRSSEGHPSDRARGIWVGNLNNRPSVVRVATYVCKEKEDGEVLPPQFVDHPYRRHFRGLYAGQPLFPALTPSPWRGLVTKSYTSATVEPMPAAVRERWTPAHERTFQKICHNDFMTQTRAAAYTYVKPYATEKRRREEQKWRRELRRQMAQYPPLPSTCPLCASEDGLMHTLLWCSHKAIKPKRIKRHNRALARLLPAIQAGRRGAHYLTGDINGWGLEDRLAELAAVTGEGVERVRDEEADPSVLHADFQQNPIHIDGLDTTDDDGSSDEYQPLDASDAESSDWSDTAITADATRQTGQYEPPPGTDRAVPTEKEGEPTRTIVPPEWGYTGTRRPDALLIVNRPMGGRRAVTGNQHAHFIDVTYTSEASVLNAIQNKFAQYKELIDLVTRLGIKWTLHVIPLGVRGFIPHHTTKALTEIGMRSKERAVFKLAVSRMAKESAVGIVWSRRREEMNLPNKEETSGAYREKLFRKAKKQSQAEFGFKTARPPGGR